MTKSKKLIILVVGIILVLCVSFIFAYLTDTDTVTNKFTIGDVDIQLNETFDQTDADNMIPGDNVQKEVSISNIGVNSAYVYMRVTIPCVTTNDINDLGKTRQDVTVNAYAIQSDNLGTGVTAANSVWVTEWLKTATASTAVPNVAVLYDLVGLDTTNWTKLDSCTEYNSTTDSEGKTTYTVTYTYYYNTVLPVDDTTTTTADEGTTTKLFTNVALRDISTYTPTTTTP